MTVNDYLSKYAEWRRPPIVCKDGFTMSVQAGSGFYCKPQIDTGPYTHVEVGYPSIKARVLNPYGRPSQGIYARVPVDVVDALIAKHGGIVAWQEVQP